MSLLDLKRPLEISDVDFRVQSINNGGYATILAYKDARVDMNRLDEVVGPTGWQRDYKLIDGKLFCGVAIFDDHKGQWIWKWDVGTESNTEAEKGQASDAFKRACFNLGIGRELYDYPVISVKLFENEWTKDGGRPRQTFDLKIKEWRWYSEFTDGRISFLAAKDQNGTIRFKWGTMKPKDKEPAYTPASGGEPIVKESQVKEDDSNPQGLVKKPSNPEASAEREALVAEYEALFGRKPHGKTSIENIKKEIDAYVSREIIEEVNTEEEVAAKPTVVHPELGIEVDDEFIDEDGNIIQEEEEEDSPIDSIVNCFDEIETYKDVQEFVAWAKDTATKYANVDAEEYIEEFKALCNAHYQNLVKQ